VLVPGAGVLEASLPVGPFTVPYAMFLLCGSGRLFSTKVALVNVGADNIKPRVTRWLSNSAARLATFRSYRDDFSLKAMERRGVDVSNDHVYADLVFGIPSENVDAGDPLTVGVGVMSYYGTNNDKARAAELHSAYVHNMKTFVRWLVDTGHKVRLLVGDFTWDYEVVEAILDDLREQRPDLQEGRVVADPITTFAELSDAIARVSTVVAIRYHNVIDGLKLSRPTISISYSKKHDTLMAEMGLSEFCQHVNELDVDRLIEQFTELEGRSTTIRAMLQERNLVKASAVRKLFDALSTTLFSDPPAPPTDDPATHLLEGATR
jgi:polysaccharide pyruvyl transferase WcaK-like protein